MVCALDLRFVGRWLFGFMVVWCCAEASARLVFTAASFLLFGYCLIDCCGRLGGGSCRRCGLVI